MLVNYKPRSSRNGNPWTSRRIFLPEGMTCKPSSSPWTFSTGTGLGQHTGDLQSSSLPGRDSCFCRPRAVQKASGCNQRSWGLGGRKGQEVVMENTGVEFKVLITVTETSVPAGVGLEMRSKNFFKRCVCVYVVRAIWGRASINTEVNGIFAL